jgi:hypothetical protein
LRRKHLKRPKTTIMITGDIRVNTIQRNSGIFIGEQNTAVGWSAHGKSNSAFGVIGSSNLVSKNISILIDPDLIDTPIDDRDQHLFCEEPGHRDGQTNIDIKAVNVNAMVQNAGLFIGKGTVNGMEAHEKDNYGTGNTYGENNLAMNNLNLNHDPDLIDATINDQDIKPFFAKEN